MDDRPASASVDEQAYLGGTAFDDAVYKLIAVTYRHGHVEIGSHESLFDLILEDTHLKRETNPNLFSLCPSGGMADTSDLLI